MPKTVNSNVGKFLGKSFLRVPWGVGRAQSAPALAPQSTPQPWPCLLLCSAPSTPVYVNQGEGPRCRSSCPVSTWPSLHLWPRPPHHLLGRQESPHHITISPFWLISPPKPRLGEQCRHSFHSLLLCPPSPPLPLHLALPALPQDQDGQTNSSFTSSV